MPAAGRHGERVWRKSLPKEKNRKRQETFQRLEQAVFQKPGGCFELDDVRKGKHEGMESA